MGLCDLLQYHMVWELGKNIEAERHFHCAVDIKQVSLQPNDNSNRLCRMRDPAAQSVTLCFDRSQHAGSNPIRAGENRRSRNNWTKRSQHDQNITK